MSKKRKNIACEKVNRGSNAKIAAAAVTGLLLTVVPAVGCAVSANKGETITGTITSRFSPKQTTL